MIAPAIPSIMPYSMIIGQEQVKLALELAFIAPRLGGVLISGQRGTGKSTAVRAFAQMVYARTPVTLPINATEDRVVGGWQIDALMREGEAKPQDGLLKEADGTVLYVDELNLLDDHIVNIILDVTASGILPVQRDGRRDEQRTRFVLVGTMNPEEGLLRPQLLDRFGLMVYVTADPDADRRAAIVQAVLDYDLAQAGDPTAVERVGAAVADDANKARQLEEAKTRLYAVAVTPEIVKACVRVTTAFELQGHRGDLVLLTAARAHAARAGATAVRFEDVQVVAQLAIQHRRKDAGQATQALWHQPDPAHPAEGQRDDNHQVAELLARTASAS